MAEADRRRRTTLADLNEEVQKVVGWVAKKYEETALWPPQTWVWREIHNQGLRHDVVVSEGSQVFNHLGSPPSEKDFVRLRPWALFDTGRCRQAFLRAYEVYQGIQSRLRTEDKVTVTRKDLGEKYSLPFASKDLHQLVWVLSSAFGGARCDEQSTDTDWTMTFSLDFLKSPMPTLEEVFLGRSAMWITEPARGPEIPDQPILGIAPSTGQGARLASLAEDADTMHKLLYERAFSREGEPELGWIESEEEARLLGWKPPRWNRAFKVLEKRGWLEVDESIGSAPFDTHGFQLNEEGILAYERATGQGQSNAGASSTEEPDARKVFIIHGRNTRARDEMETFLQALGLDALRFGNVRASLGGTPTIAQVVERGMDQAQGVVAVFTADEYAAVRPEYREPRDKPEDQRRWQARPNVIFEAGMAFGRDRRRVVFVLLGDPSLCSDLAGIHVLMPTNDAGPNGHRAVLRQTLASMGCKIDPNLEGWREAGDFVTCVPPVPGEVRDPFSEERPSTESFEPGLTSAASQLLAGIGQRYVENGYPLHTTWNFGPGAGQEIIFNELRSHGLVKTQGQGTKRWVLTDSGLGRVLAALATIPTTLVDVLAIAGRDEASVAKTLGKPASAKDTKDGPTSTYVLANGVKVEIIYLDGNAEWITVTPGSTVPVHFGEDALRVLGLPSRLPSFRSPAVLRWGNISGLLEVSIFPGAGENVDYLYIKVHKP
jgi:predicted nucleotide-binding protein